MFIAPRHDLQPAPSTEELDSLLLKLLHGGVKARSLAFPRLQCAPSERVFARFAAVRPSALAPGALCHDALDLISVFPPPDIAASLSTEWGFVTVCNGKYVPHALTLVASLRRIGGIPDDVPVVVFAIDGAAWMKLRDRTDVVAVRCELAENVAVVQWVNLLRLTAPRLFPNVKRWVMLEADMLARSEFWKDLNDLGSLADDGGILGVRQQFFEVLPTLHQDCERLGMVGDAVSWVTRGGCHSGPAWFNEGLQIGTAKAFRELDAKLRSWLPQSRLFCEGSLMPWGEEVLTNIALNCMDATPQQLDDTWNHQIVDWAKGIDYAPDTCNGKTAKLQHFISGGRDKPGFWRTARHLGFPGPEQLLPR